MPSSGPHRATATPGTLDVAASRQQLLVRPAAARIADERLHRRARAAGAGLGRHFRRGRRSPAADVLSDGLGGPARAAAPAGGGFRPPARAVAGLLRQARKRRPDEPRHQRHETIQQASALPWSRSQRRPAARLDRLDMLRSTGPTRCSAWRWCRSWSWPPSGSAARRARPSAARARRSATSTPSWRKASPACARRRPSAAKSANIESFRVSNAANRDANVRAVAYTSALAPTLEALGYVAIALVAGVGGLLHAAGADARRRRSSRWA